VTQPMRQWSASIKQFVAIVLTVVALFFLAGVVSRIIDLYNLKQEHAALLKAQHDLETKISQLQNDITYLQSDSYVETAARQTLMWGHPGDKLILSTSITSYTPTPRSTPQR
jgi:cell division protein FtsB